MTYITALDRLADVLSYPTDGYRATVEVCRAALEACAPDAAADVAQFAHATKALTIGQLQELYTSTFDLNPASALELGWHLFGDTYDRGGFLAALRGELAVAGVKQTTDLPDHLSQVLRLAGRLERQRAAEFAALVAPVVERICSTLESRQNQFALLLRAVKKVTATLIPDAAPVTLAGIHEG
jgi:nitrate reductase delta subunit